MKRNLIGVLDALGLNRIFCVQYCAYRAEPFCSAFFMLNQKNLRPERRLRPL